MKNRVMRKCLFAMFAALLLVPEAHAVVISLKLTNKSARVVTALAAKSRNDGSMATTALAASVAVGAEGRVQITQTGSDCVYDLTLSFGTASPLTLTNIDICQADALIVE
jgi:hypothetical protein